MSFDQLSGMSNYALLVAYANGTEEAAQILTARLMPKILSIANVPRNIPDKTRKSR